jgi:hypothetical protein
VLVMQLTKLVPYDCSASATRNCLIVINGPMLGPSLSRADALQRRMEYSGGGNRWGLSWPVAVTVVAADGPRGGHIFTINRKPNRTVPNRTEISVFLVVRFSFGFCI